MRALRTLFLTSGVVFYSLALSPGLWAATEVPEEAKAQLISQAEEFRKEKEEITPEAPEKPEIVVKKEKKEELGEKGPSFLIKRIKLEGNTIFSDKDLEPYTSQFVNKEMTFRELKTLAQMITNHYRANGYTTSRAYVPPQTIVENTVTIKIIEGDVAKILVEGNKYFSDQVYIDSIHLRKDRVFRFQDLETSLYFLNQKPDRKAKAYLLPAEEIGAFDIVLKAEETFPMHAYYEFNNRGTKLTHRARHEIHVDHNNITGHGDILNASLSLAEEGAFDAVSFNYLYPNEKTGTTWSLGTSYVKSMLIGHLKPAEVKGESITVSPGITQSFVKTPAILADAFVGFDIKDSKTSIDDNKSSFDRVRVIRAGPRFTFQDVQGRTVASGDIHWGIPNFLGSMDTTDPLSSRPNSGGKFFYYTANFARAQRIPWSSFVILRGGGQWGQDNLPSVEQYRLGGAYTVRGYPESDATGDYGYNFSGELNFPAFFLPKKWGVPFSQKKWYDTIRLVGFLEGGKTYLRERAAETVVKDKFLLGTGFGLRFDFNPYTSFTVDFGWPIGDDSTDEDQMQVHLSARAGF